MTKRQITPHKGGRTARIFLRARPDIKAKLEQYAKAAGVTVADIIEQLIDNLQERNIIMYQYKLFQIEDEETGKTRYMIIDDNMDNPEYYLEYDEKIVTDCWLSDLIKCENEDIFIAPPVQYN